MVQTSRWKTHGQEDQEAARWGYTMQVNWNVDEAYGSSQGFPTGSSFKAFTLAAALRTA